jgi:hypothetical protein
MSELTEDILDGADRATAVQRFLAQFPDANRAEAIHLALRALRARVEPDRVLACELAWELHTRGFWSQLKGPDGRPYPDEETYFRDVIGLSSWRTAYKRLAIGRMLLGFEDAERVQLRAVIAEVGVAKTAMVVPAIERLGQWQRWLELAQELSAVSLQQQVSAALQALPRGREPSPPGEHFRRTVLAAMPDIEAMELVERYFDLGARVVGTGHPVAIFLAGCRECLTEWEIQVAGARVVDIERARRAVHRERGGDDPAQDLGGADRLDVTDVIRRVCPHGQNGTGPR